MKWYIKTVSREYRRIFSGIDFIGDVRDCALAVVAAIWVFLGSVFAAVYLLFGLWWFYPLARVWAEWMVVRTFRKNLALIRGGKIGIGRLRIWIGSRQKLFPESRHVRILSRAVRLQDAKKCREWRREWQDENN